MIWNRWMGAVACGLAVGFVAGCAMAVASTIGTNPPAESLTRERVERLGGKDKAVWLAYLERSQMQRRADKDSLHIEMKQAGLTTPTEPPHGFSARSIPLEQAAAWYCGAEARHIGNVIVSFQTPAGGWGKNTDMSKSLRVPGEAYTTNNLSRFPSADDFDTPKEPEWNYVGTIDNDATTTQMNFLAKVAGAARGEEGTAYRKAFLRGMEYLFAAEFPNGGWPQVWPLEGGYHDAITFNDDAVTQVVELMGHAADGKDEFRFVPEKVRKRAAASFERGIRCILATQIVVKGKRTVWAQQNDALTLEPVSARNYEPPAKCGSESASVMLLLMDGLQNPTTEEQVAIRAAAEWYKKTAIYGQSWERGPDGRQLVAKPGAGPIWARYYEIDNDIPVFADRDKTIHDDVGEISKERRNGYNWYSAEGKRALERFETWNAEHPEKR